MYIVQFRNYSCITSTPWLDICILGYAILFLKHIRFYYAIESIELSVHVTPNILLWYFQLLN